MRIHGAAYIIVGAIVSISSFILNKEKLGIFIWVGIAMIAFGFIRMLILSAKPAKKQRSPTQKGAKILQNFCPMCGAALHSYQNFCHMCGYRLHFRR